MSLPMHACARENVPKKPARPNAYSEGEDEAPGLIDQEPVDVEHDVPDTENISIEGDEPQEPEPPLFDE